MCTTIWHATSRLIRGEWLTRTATHLACCELTEHARHVGLLASSLSPAGAFLGRSLAGYGMAWHGTAIGSGRTMILLYILSVALGISKVASARTGIHGLGFWIHTGQDLDTA